MPSMAVTFLAGEAVPASLDAGVSPLAELAALLHGLADPSHHQPAAPALERARQALTAEAERELQALSPLWSGYRARFLYPGAAGLGRSLEEELTLLGSYREELFFESAAWAVRGGYTGAAPVEALLSEPAARAGLLGRASARSSEALLLMHQLLEDPAALKGRIVSFLGSCAEAFFAAEWDQVRETLAADANARELLALRAGPLATIASLSRSARILPGPPRVRFEKVHHGRVDLAHARVLLVPSTLTWPHLLVKHEPGWPALVHYPLREISPAPTAPLVDEMRQRLEVLAEPTRLRLCRLIGQSPSTTSDLAARLVMSAPQVSRHLRVLRKSGLVDRSRDGRRVRYHLCQDQVARIGIDLLAALLR